jgi:hypothetical protein
MLVIEKSCASGDASLGPAASGSAGGELEVQAAAESKQSVVARSFMPFTLATVTATHAGNDRNDPAASLRRNSPS